MSDAALPGPGRATPGRRGGVLNRLLASPRFQSWASRFPLTAPIARRDGAALFDVVAGFVHSQALFALVELRVLHLLVEGPRTVRSLAAATGLHDDRAQVLLQSGAALDLLKRRRDGRFALSRKGAALLGVPGLEGMIRHHRAFYRDLEDPVALLRGECETELAEFWPYVFGARGGVDPALAERYSELMADSQALVAEETLRQVSFKGLTRLLDVGGGSGAFLAAVARAYPALEGQLLDLPQVVPAAQERFAKAGLEARLSVVGDSFRDAPLPTGADAVSLIRVLYDHSDDTVRLLLRRVAEALPLGGRLIVSEPMSGGETPERSGDVYFAFYTLAMRTGRARSQEQIADLAREAGFGEFERPRSRRPYVTSVLTARRVR